MTAHLEQLERTIEDLWRQGLTLSPDALHYIDSTFSHPSVEALEELLADESNCERDSLLELIFFPDRSLQIQLEDLLEKYDFQAEDEATISRSLASKSLQTALVFPDGRGRLALAVPDGVIARFISRLNLARKPDPALVEAIRRHVPPPHQALCKVMLRNTRFKITTRKMAFLCGFFEKMAFDFGVVLSAYELLLSILEELEADTDFYRALMQKKRFYFKNLEKAERFSAQLKSSNMETLLLQGVRMPHFDMEAARRRIDLINKICLAVFGRTDFLETGGCVDLEAVKRANDLDTMFAFLS